MTQITILYIIGSYAWVVFKTWWWAISPLILFFALKSFYLWWVQWEVWYKKIKWIVLEIRPPKEILKPFRAMEDVYSLLWGFYDSANWRERWCEGEFPKAPYWFSFEIASTEGGIHFYMRIPDNTRNMVESSIYAHYPDVEISLVEDYTKRLPQDMPNKDWELKGEDYTLLRDDSYPIKTYEQFFEERPEVTKEEKRLDPLDSLMEEMAKLGAGEHFWWQVVAAPILDADIPWITEGRELANKIAKRQGKPKLKSFLQQATEEVTSGLILGTKTAEAEQKEKALSRKADESEEKELLLSPEERRVLSAVERKISKRGFKIWMRALYICKKDVDHGRNKIVRTYLNHFATEDLNTILYWGPTRTRIHYWFRTRRLFLRKRKILKNYVRRLPPMYPRATGRAWFPFPPVHLKRKGWFVANTEELATLYHLPAKVSVLTPAIKPIEVKKGGPPPGLPTA